MPRITQLSACSVLALGVATGPAFADLSAQEVWDGMENMLLGFGYTVSATETATSNGLNVSDISMVIDMPEDNGNVTVGVEQMTFVENSDGSVRIELPASLPIAVAAAPEGEDAVSMVIDYTNTGLDLVVSGDMSNMLYTYAADSLAVSLRDLIVNGEPIAREEARFDLVLNDVSGTTSSKEDGARELNQELEIGGITYDIAFNDPETNEAGLFSGSMESASVTSTSVVPEGFSPADPQSFANGFSSEGVLKFTNGQMEFAGTEEAGTTSGTSQSASVDLTFAMDGTNLQYGVAATEQAVTISGPELPVPVNVSMAESGFNLRIPIAQSETPEDVAFGLTLGGFEMSDLLWNMFDPGAALPRDPATIMLDLTGKVTPFVNLFDPAAMAELEGRGDAPAELNALTLEGLTIDVAGAKLGGTGAFTFDNTDMETFGGVPRPSGGVDLTLEGANGLIDKLISMGMLTEEDAMGARMMMSMFAVPGDGPDSLNSSIQINDQGHVLANGMRIQ